MRGLRSRSGFTAVEVFRKYLVRPCVLTGCGSMESAACDKRASGAAAKLAAAALLECRSAAATSAPCNTAIPPKLMLITHDDDG